MSQSSFTLVAGIVFLLIAVGHVLRLFLGISLVIYDVTIPMWASIVAAPVMGFLAYEGFHLARKGDARM